MLRPLKMKKTLLGPRYSSDIKIGQISDKTKLVPHKVKMQIPKAASMVVSMAYSQATGPVVV